MARSRLYRRRVLLPNTHFQHFPRSTRFKALCTALNYVIFQNQFLRISCRENVWPVFAFGRIFLFGSHSLASPLRGLFRFARLASCRYGILAGSLAEHSLTISGSLPRTLRKGSLSAGTSSPAGSVRLEFSSDCFFCGFSVVFLFSGMRVSFSRFWPAFCETTLLEGAAGSLPSGSSQPAGSVQVKKK